MSEREARLAALRASLGRAGPGKAPPEGALVPLGHDAADACLQGGLRRGALHEVFAAPGHEPAAMGFAALLCGRIAARAPVLWIRMDRAAAEYGELAALGWHDLGLDPARLLLLRVADATGLLRAGHDALSCGALGAVVMECLGTPKQLTLTASQRLTLESARTGVTALLLRFNASAQSSTAETRWQVKALRSPPDDARWGRPLFDVHLARNRHGRTGRFALEWRRDHGVFRPARGAADFGAVVSASSDRQGASAGDGGS